MPHKARSLICGCKGNILFWFLQIFQQLSFKKAKKKTYYLDFSSYFLTFARGFRINLSGFSAVGSALRSGRRGRAFESPNPDFYEKYILSSTQRSKRNYRHIDDNSYHLLTYYLHRRRGRRFPTGSCRLYPHPAPGTRRQGTSFIL